jgi:hypothetical protein
VGAAAGGWDDAQANAKAINEAEKKANHLTGVIQPASMANKF